MDANINEIAAALAKAQGQIKAAKRDRNNPHFNNRYATLDSIIEAVRAPLSTNGLSFSQLLQQDETGLVLETWLMHESGQHIVSRVLVQPMNAKGVNQVQALGSTLTYLKRYALAAMLGVGSDDDDDGNGAIDQRSPRPNNVRNSEGNGKGTKVSTPRDLLETINKRVLVPYDSVSHLFNAIREESTLDDYSWPSSQDTEGWRTAYRYAKEHADKKADQETA